jgi:hypothetical protein
MKTSSTFNKVINDAGQLALTEGHTVLTSSPRVTPCGLLSFGRDKMNRQGLIELTNRLSSEKRTKRIKKLRATIIRKIIHTIRDAYQDAMPDNLGDLSNIELQTAFLNKFNQLTYIIKDQTNRIDVTK